MVRVLIAPPIIHRTVEISGGSAKWPRIGAFRRYTLPLMGRYRRELIDEEAGVYRYDHLIVLHSAHMPAVLLEAGSIINRQEELELATPERRLMVAEAITAAVEEFCGTRGQAVAGQPPATPASVAITAHSRGARPASLSRHKRIHSAKT
jgi:N-acetylmuramoyl-L-alanine amidase